MPRALLSVYDKTGIVEFAQQLHDLGWELISSGGTATVISSAGIPVIDVAEITGYPAILGHRVVTLHPSIHGALLGDVSDAEHVAEMQRLNIAPISLAIVNLYPFSTNPSIELIDVGGPAMVRAAAKNHAHVAVVTDPSQYGEILTAIQSSSGISDTMRKSLAAQAFAVTAEYDAQVARWFSDSTSVLPERMSIHLVREELLRYGENPHQLGARYRIVGNSSWWSTAQQLGGKELSYLNVLDGEAAWNLVSNFDSPCVAIIKHANPCGMAVAKSIEMAYENALACDPVSAFGGIVALNRTVNLAVAEQVIESGVDMVGIATALAIDPNLPNQWKQGQDIAPALSAITWENKTLASLANMATVKFQLRKLSAGKKTNPKVAPLWALILQQTAMARRTRQYKNHMRDYTFSS